MLLKSFVIAGLSAVVYAQGTPDLVTALGSNSMLSQLAALVKAQPSLASSLANAANNTVLAPNNDAISKLLNSSAGAAVSSNPGAVAALLSYHVLQGTYFGSQIT